MERVIKLIKRRFGKGFTLMLVPNSSESIKSCSIPFSAAVIILGIILINIYVFATYTTQIMKVHHFREEISRRNHYIAKLEREQREVKPTLERSRQIAGELTELKAERARIINALRAVQQKSGRSSYAVSRGALVRTQPYILAETKTDDGVVTDIDKLKNNLKQLSVFVDAESKEERNLLLQLISYEQKLDHTPSIWPVATRINSWFGYRRHPLYGRYYRHSGVDIQAGYGTRVRAAADGIVKTAGYLGGYGYAVVIDHGYGYETLYGHNSKLKVTCGQRVKKGQVISYSGNSGASTGPHLHYEVRINDNPVNPVLFLRK